MEQLKIFREDLHQMPELGFEEIKTQAYILEAVKTLRCQVETVKTGVILYFDKGADKTIAFRADMDGLPITEQTGLPYASKHGGKMHGCGHDGHMAILLGLANKLDSWEGDLRVNVVLVFQPSEERDAGANVIIDSGILTQYGVEAMFGLHLWPGLEQGQVYTRKNEFMAADNAVTIDILGKSAHVADAEKAADALYVASHLLCDAYGLEKTLPKEIYRLLKFGKITSGTAANIISDEAQIKGTVRSYDPEVHAQLQNGLEQIAKKYDDTYGTATTITYGAGYEALINDPDLVDKVIALCPDVTELEKPVLQAEDFGLYRKVCPITYFFLGVGDTAPLHNPKFDFNTDVLINGLNLFINILSGY